MTTPDIADLAAQAQTPGRTLDLLRDTIEWLKTRGMGTVKIRCRSPRVLSTIEGIEEHCRRWCEERNVSYMPSTTTSVRISELLGATVEYDDSMAEDAISIDGWWPE